jgi:hypothetical protein
MNRSFERILAVAGAAAVLAVGVDAVTYAATGKALILGHTNTANRTTTLRNTGSGAALNLITKKSSSAPFGTNAQGQVANLNASKLDGLTARQISGHFALISTTSVVSRSSGGVSVSNPSPGIFCVTVAGVNPGTSVATATPDYATDATIASTLEASQAVVEFDSGHSICAITTFEVRTFVSRVVQGTPTTAATTAQNQPFFFITPQ